MRGSIILNDDHSSFLWALLVNIMYKLALRWIKKYECSGGGACRNLKNWENGNAFYDYYSMTIVML
jgi:hypothetical protein